MEHNSIAMTMRYSHLAPNHLSNAVGALVNALKKPELVSEASDEDHSRNGKEGQ